MATLRTGLPDNYLVRLAFMEDVLYDEIKVEDGVVPSVVKIRDMGDRPFVNTTTIASFGSVPIKLEGQDVAYDDLAQGYNKQYLADTYELAFQTSKEALDDEQEEVVSDAARALGNSLTFTYNTDHANLYNDGFTSTTGSPDGAVIFSTAHPLIGGGNGSNTLGTAADLSVQAMRDLQNVIADTVDDAGKLLHWRPRTLLLPTELGWLGKELVRSTEKPDTADRAINAFRDDDLTVIVWPYLTDPDAWFLLGDANTMNIRSYWREKSNLLHDWSFESSSMKVKIRARWIRGWSDYKGVAGSPGA